MTRKIARGLPVMQSCIAREEIEKSRQETIQKFTKHEAEKKCRKKHEISRQ
jgi:hypothetical protein